MKNLCIAFAALLCSGLAVSNPVSALSANRSVAPQQQTSPAVPDTTIGVILVAPVTMEITDSISAKMKQQQQELVNGWEIFEAAADQNDTIVSVEIVPDQNSLDAIKLGLDDSVLFMEGSAKLSPKAEAILSRVAENLNNFPETDVTIVGYTSTTGTQQVNMDLSMSRAQNVMDYLVAKGVDATRMKAIGKNWQDPVATNATAAGRAMNRRVEIWVTANQQMIDNMQQ
ncbi:MAG: OmpA family protein [Bacteroidales bacterium]